MNQNAPQPSFELPPLPGDSRAMPENNQGETAASQPEKYTAPPVALPQQPGASPQGGVSGQPLPQAPVPLTAAAPIDPAALPAIADDAELIEKEWVVKAKQIVAATREDPYAQTKEISKFKADYLKKRYNKDLKIEES